VISLMSLDGEGRVTFDGTVFSVVHGKSDRAMPVVPGAYLYVILSDHERGALYGTEHASDAAAGTPMKIAWSGKLLQRDSLGKGIELVTLEEMSCANLPQNLRQILWPKTWGAEVTVLFVPEHCEYTVMN